MLRRVQTAATEKEQKEREPRGRFRSSFFEFLGLESFKIARLAKLMDKCREAPHTMLCSEVCDMCRHFTELRPRKRNPALEKELFWLLSKVIVCTRDPFVKVTAERERSKIEWEVEKWPQ